VQIGFKQNSNGSNWGRDTHVLMEHVTERGHYCGHKPEIENVIRE